MINYDISKKLSYPFIRRECTLRAYHSEKLYNRSLIRRWKIRDTESPSYIFLSIGSDEVERGGWKSGCDASTGTFFQPTFRPRSYYGTANSLQAHLFHSVTRDTT